MHTIRRTASFLVMLAVLTGEVLTAPFLALKRDLHSVDRAQSGNGGIIGAAFLVLVLVIVVALVALVGGEFLTAVDTDNGTFSTEITEMEGHTGTAITILGIILIVIPAVAVVGYLRDNLGGLMGGGGNGGFGGFR